MIGAALCDVNYMVDVGAVVVAAVFMLTDTASPGDDVGPGGFPAWGVGASLAAVPVVGARWGGHCVMTISLLHCDITIMCAGLVSF